MKLKIFETPGISHYAYLLADDGIAALVDPRRDVEEYLEAAREMGVRIDYILETHRHEDFVMGSTHAAERTGAKVVNGQHDCFGRGDMRLADGDEFELGRLRIVALHTPGHTPESMCWAVYDPQTPNAAWGVFTGDTLFFGDTGRSDLPDQERSEENAGLIHDSVHRKLASLGDSALILPAHGPGSVCGSGMSERPLSTLGAEKTYNKVFTLDRDEFARAKGGEELPRPPYFRHLEQVNLRGGKAPKLRAEDVRLLNPAEFSDEARGGIVIDTREPEAFAGGHVPKAYSVWQGGAPIFGGWVASHEDAVFLCGSSNADVATTALHLTRIGIDDIRGALRGGFGSWRDAGRPLGRGHLIEPKRLAEHLEEFTVLDVREIEEFAGGHIPGAKNVYVGHLEDELSSLPFEASRPIAVTCGVGHRASVAVSMLLRAGFKEVHNLLGGMKAWTALDLATERGAT